MKQCETPLASRRNEPVEKKASRHEPSHQITRFDPHTSASRARRGQMATTFPRLTNHRVSPVRRAASCDFIQALMKLQRAAQLINSTLDLDHLLDRVVNDIAASLGCVEV